MTTFPPEKKPHPLSAEAVSDYIGVDCDHPSIPAMIDAALANVQRYIGYDINSDGKQVEYFRDITKTIPLNHDRVKWELHVHENGQWVKQEAEQIGDVICVMPCSCSCSCSGCHGAPRYRLTTWDRCSKTESAIIYYVNEFVAYSWSNRGDIDPKKLSALLNILKPYMKVVYC